MAFGDSSSNPGVREHCHFAAIAQSYPVWGDAVGHSLRGLGFPVAAEPRSPVFSGFVRRDRFGGNDRACGSFLLLFGARLAPKPRVRSIFKSESDSHFDGPRRNIGFGSLCEFFSETRLVRNSLAFSVYTVPRRAPAHQFPGAALSPPCRELCLVLQASEVTVKGFFSRRRSDIAGLCRHPLDWRKCRQTLAGFAISRTRIPSEDLSGHLPAGLGVACPWYGSRQF